MDFRKLQLAYRVAKMNSHVHALAEKLLRKFLQI